MKGNDVPRVTRPFSVLNVRAPCELLKHVCKPRLRLSVLALNPRFNSSSVRPLLTAWGRWVSRHPGLSSGSEPPSGEHREQ